MENVELIEELEDSFSTIVMLAKSPSKFGPVEGMEGEMLQAIQRKAEAALDRIYADREVEGE